ncbi:sterigmatocystin biosynthesis P450 monooxygenase StcS [Lophiotrema nucula]|uniref:Sterigmatocystin biosynthesis P450 monooxygenase StcS n=1 Tax=Lophiotrema nucula TaxID=690887 RepID=A0A6A5Z4L8_9PLEO|nr:sterigmatocystin biosynthesis P450 monooxygenase StcS [Lophiotrema nucula]
MSILTISLLVAPAVMAAVFFRKLYHARMLLRDRQRRGLPTAPGHSLLFGHLLYMASVLRRLPKDAHYQYAFSLIAQEHFYNEGCFYLDLWPVQTLLLISVSPTIGIQMTQTNLALQAHRPHFLRHFFKPITGGSNLFDLDEKDWKPWRTIFNKGFHSDRIMSLVPNMIEETATYANVLRGIAAKGEMVLLEPFTLKFTVDIIGKNVLNTSLRSQGGYNPLADGMMSTLRWHKSAAALNPLSHINPVRFFIQWRNGRQMDRYIGAEIDKLYECYKSEKSKTPPESVMDLILQSYVSDRDESVVLPDVLDATFRSFAIRQVRLFLFVGYEYVKPFLPLAAASVLCYSFHLLSKHPKVLARLRAEHDEALGTDPTVAGSRFVEDARIIHSLPYTLAVIKEVMRFFPPAGTNREGKPGVVVYNDAGFPMMTEDAIISMPHTEVHVSPKHWVRPLDFLPERWLVPADHELHPVPGAYLPFGSGPRNCIAQSLILTEMRVVLALLIRTFDVSPAYDEYDKKYPDKGIKTVRGERAYLIERGASHPTAQYPCRIRLAEKTG